MGNLFIHNDTETSSELYILFKTFITSGVALMGISINTQLILLGDRTPLTLIMFLSNSVAFWNSAWHSELIPCPWVKYKLQILLLPVIMDGILQMVLTMIDNMLSVFACMFIYLNHWVKFYLIIPIMNSGFSCLGVSWISYVLHSSSYFLISNTCFSNSLTFKKWCLALFNCYWCSSGMFQIICFSNISNLRVGTGAINPGAGVGRMTICVYCASSWCCIGWLSSYNSVSTSPSPCIWYTIVSIIVVTRCRPIGFIIFRHRAIMGIINGFRAVMSWKHFLFGNSLKLSHVDIIYSIFVFNHPCYNRFTTLLLV